MKLVYGFVCLLRLLCYRLHACYVVVLERRAYAHTHQRHRRACSCEARTHCLLCAGFTLALSNANVQTCHAMAATVNATTARVVNTPMCHKFTSTIQVVFVAFCKRSTPDFIACVNITYLPKAYGIRLSLQIDGRILFEEEFSGEEKRDSPLIMSFQRAIRRRSVWPSHICIT